MAFSNRPILQNLFDKQLAPFGINSQYMFLIKICRSPGILQDSLMNMFYVHPSNIVRTVALEKQGNGLCVPQNDKDKRTCKLYPTERALSVIDEVQTVCEKTEALYCKASGIRIKPFSIR